MQNCLQNLEVYIISRKISLVAWEVYKLLDYTTKKTIGDQFIRSIDSIGANIAEGYGRFHYLDKIKFFYNARGSFFEGAYHWTELLMERNMIDEHSYYEIRNLSSDLAPKLNRYIKSIYNAKQNNEAPIPNS